LGHKTWWPTKGIPKAAKRAEKWSKKEAINWAVNEYAKLKEEAQEKNKLSVKRVRVEKGALKELIVKAKEKFDLEDDFNVPLSTIQSRIKADNLEVWHTGEVSPVLGQEVVLQAYIYSANLVKCPLTQSDTIALMNTIIKGTPKEKELIKWKKNRNMYNPDAPLLGRAWFNAFRRRNPNLSSQIGRKYPRCRDEHCTTPAFVKMFNQFEYHLVQSGNAVKFPEPVHMDRLRRIVEDEKRRVWA